MTLVGSRLYIGAEDGKLLSLEQRDRSHSWRYQTRSAIRGRIAVVAGIVYFGSADGYAMLSERWMGVVSGVPEPARVCNPFL